MTTFSSKNCINTYVSQSLLTPKNIVSSIFFLHQTSLFLQFCFKMGDPHTNWLPSEEDQLCASWTRLTVCSITGKSIAVKIYGKRFKMIMLKIGCVIQKKFEIPLLSNLIFGI